MGPLAKRRAAVLLMAAALFVADQALKAWLLGALRLREVGLIKLIPFFDLRYTENRGISLGLLTADTREGHIMLLLLTGAITLGVTVWILREKAWGDLIALGMVLGGALGNIRDRQRFGYVVDYADLHIGDFRPFMIFNLADVAITLGVVLLLARALLIRDKPAQESGPDTGPNTGGTPATET